MDERPVLKGFEQISENLFSYCSPFVIGYASAVVDLRMGCLARASTRQSESLRHRWHTYPFPALVFWFVLFFFSFSFLLQTIAHSLMRCVRA